MVKTILKNGAILLKSLIVLFLVIGISARISVKNLSHWNIEIADSGGYLGTHTSIALDNNNYPYISYYDHGNENLKYARWTGTTWNIETVDSAGSVGEYTSLALDTFDRPHISYYDNSNDDLKHAWGWAPYEDTFGTWDSSGVWYRDSVTGSWHLMSSPAYLVAAGDLDGDRTDDLIGVWNSGLWVKQSSANIWLLITPSLSTDIASGDMNGDGRDDILGAWPSGSWYRDSISGSWIKMSTPASLVAADDTDGDGTDDLIGTWSSGLWVKNSSTTSWEFICTSLPSDIDAGLFRSGWDAEAMSYDAPIVGVYAEGPGNLDNYEDLSSEAPGGRNFVYQEEENLMPVKKIRNKKKKIK